MKDSEIEHFPTIKQSLLLGVRFILYSIGVGLVMGIFIGMFRINDKTTTSFLMMLGYLISIIITIWVGFKKFRENEESTLKIKFSKFPLIAILVSIVMILTVPLITDPFSILFPVPKFLEKLFADMSNATVFAVTTSIILAPIFEEILFRGIILNGLLKNYTPQKSIVISAAIFAAIHLNPWQAIPAFLGGILIGWMYWKTNSVIPGIILHFVNNLSAVLLSQKFNNASTFNQLVSLPIYILLLASSAIIFIAGFIFLDRFFKTNITAVKETILIIDENSVDTASIQSS